MTQGESIRKNDEILVSLTVESNGHLQIERGQIVSLVTRSEEAVSDFTQCVSLSRLFDSHAGTTFSYGAFSASSKTPGAAPYKNGTIEMQSIWTATPTTSEKDDAAFGKGACPGALTGYYKSLSRYNTSFIKYKESEVIDVFKKISGYEEYVKVTAYAYMYKEQPPKGGEFSFPNNNVAGIQTDGNQQAGLSTSDIDFQTCFKDAETWRAFAGFTTIDRGLNAYLATIKARFADKWSSRLPSGTPDEYATQMADNYFQGWNTLASDTELKSLKTDGSFTRGSTTYERNYTSTKSSFLAKYKEYTGTA